MSDELLYHAANARALGTDGERQIWTVSQVNSLTRKLLEGSIPLLRVAGEISGFKRYRSGHCYFTLKDEHAQLNCVMWSDDARRLPAAPPEGMAVHVFGQPSVYVRAGRLQFVVRELQAQGEGLWKLAFERIRKKLQAEGLLDPRRKRRLPRFPSCVGVVTSAEGAALRDICTVIRKRAPWTDILVYATRVQGDGAAVAIVAAIRKACKANDAEVLIVGRGGGSVEDLWAFNDERVARAIAGSPIPVISAVGHETDVTMADLVADRRAATPSAAAELAVPDKGLVQGELVRASTRLRSILEVRLERGRRRTEFMEGQLLQALGRNLAQRRARLEAVTQRLRALGPLAVLQRGYAVAQQDGRILRSITDFAFPMQFTLRLQDGRIAARAERVEAEE